MQCVGRGSLHLSLCVPSFLCVRSPPSLMGAPCPVMREEKRLRPSRSAGTWHRQHLLPHLSRNAYSKGGRIPSRHLLFSFSEFSAFYLKSLSSKPLCPCVTLCETAWLTVPLCYFLAQGKYEHNPVIGSHLNVCVIFPTLGACLVGLIVLNLSNSK